MLFNNIVYGEFSYKGTRKENQDAYFSLVKDKIAAFAVADGMGGYCLGREIAIAIVDALKKEIDLCNYFSYEYLSKLLNKKYFQINDFLYEKYRAKGILTGSTLSSICFVEDKYIVMNVGDTKICRIRDNKIETISKIHNVAAEQYEKGKISRLGYVKHNGKNILTQCIGMEKDISPHFDANKFFEGDYYIICSDGVYNYVDDDDILKIFLQKRIVDDEALRIICKEIVLKAYNDGSKDNMTMIAVKLL